MNVFEVFIVIYSWLWKWWRVSRCVRKDFGQDACIIYLALGHMIGPQDGAR